MSDKHDDVRNGEKLVSESGLLALALRALARPPWAGELVGGLGLQGTAASARAASRGPGRGPAPAGAGSRSRGAATVAHVVLVDVVVGVGVVKLGWRRPTSRRA